MTKQAILLATFMLASTASVNADHTYNPSDYSIEAIRAAIKMGGEDEYRLRLRLSDIMTDTSNEWDDVLRRWRHRTDPNDADLQAAYQEWWDLLNERVDQKMAGREFASELDRLTVWMALAHHVDNDMPLAPINEVVRDMQTWR